MSQVSRLKSGASKREVENFYDVTASSYDRLYGEEQREKYSEAFRLLGNLKLSGVALDAGCGTGLLFERLEAFREIVAVDISRKMLSEARVKACRRQVHLVRCDIERLPFRGKVFDFCSAFTVLQNLPNPEEALRELERVSSPKAVLAVTLMEGSERLPSPEEAFRLLRLKEAKLSKVRRELLLVGLKEFSFQR